MRPRNRPRVRLGQRIVPRLKGEPINTLIPNILTVLALCSGMTAIRFAMLDRFEWAVICIVLAGIFDGLDGRMARLLGGTSKFGAELDSLSDFAAFGVAPAVLVYYWSLRYADGMGWAVCLLYATCCALRLARFNTAIGDPNLPPYAYRYFQGVPAPSGAGLAMLPMMIEFELGFDVMQSRFFMAPWIVLVALLMISRIPTFSLKSIKIPQPYVLPVFIGLAVLTATFASYPWIVLSIIGIWYVLSIPVSVRNYHFLKREAERMQRGAAAAATATALLSTEETRPAATPAPNAERPIPEGDPV
ncbi:MAG: phosphatidylcholine/phosphatidylserine synthase [Alphaproteobacteria bacterium]|nr:phosphatidylcholine/phosphatidylserine synthase [Alphaproteobacteria bacterium]